MFDRFLLFFFTQWDIYRSRSLDFVLKNQSTFRQQCLGPSFSTHKQLQLHRFALNSNEKQEGFSVTYLMDDPSVTDR